MQIVPVVMAVIVLAGCAPKSTEPPSVASPEAQPEYYFRCHLCEASQAMTPLQSWPSGVYFISDGWSGQTLKFGEDGTFTSSEWSCTYSHAGPAGTWTLESSTLKLDWTMTSRLSYRFELLANATITAVQIDGEAHAHVELENGDCYLAKNIVEQADAADAPSGRR